MGGELMNTQAKIALDKQKHPDRFCSVHRCLWKVVKLDPWTQTYSLRPDCPGGYCPRHANRAGSRQIDVLEPIRRATYTEGFLFSALRVHGVFDSQ
jgi:hypothetical protein